VARAIIDSGCQVVDCGHIPTPALAYYAMNHDYVSIMVTGSHIPDDRNGIKFYKKDREILKEDESSIIDSVAYIRQEEYCRPNETSLFNTKAMFKQNNDISCQLSEEEAIKFYAYRYIDVFGRNALKGMKVVFDQHSAVGRDIIPDILHSLGAEVIKDGWSKEFVSKDTENITKDTLNGFYALAKKHHPFAIVSTDGDSDRPFVVDGNGQFYRGDILGAVTAQFLSAQCCVFPAHQD